MSRARLIGAVDRMSDALAAAAAVLLACAALVIVWNVVYRASGASTYWEIEAAVYMMVAALFLGSPYCLKTRGHVAVDLLAHYLPLRHERRLQAVVSAIGLAVCLYLAWRGAEFAFESFVKGERTESTWAPPKWPLLATMPLGLALTSLQYVAELLRLREPAANAGAGEVPR